MTSRTKTTRIARLLLAAMLFAQVAVALAACESLVRTPALAVSQTDRQANVETCHEEQATNGNTNLCLAHCLAGDQTLDKPGVSVPPLAATAVLAVLSLDRLLPEAASPRKVAVPPATAPPRILFRTLLI